MRDRGLTPIEKNFRIADQPPGSRTWRTPPCIRWWYGYVVRLHATLTWNSL